MKIQNALRQEVAMLYNNEILQEGQYKKQFQQDLPKGIYIVTLQTKTTQQTIRVIKQ